MLQKLVGWAKGLNTIGQCAVTFVTLVPVAAGAVAVIKKYHRPDPAVVAGFQTGVGQLAAKDFRGAEASFETVLAAAPDYPDARYSRARALASLGRYGDALADALAAEQAAPDDPKALVLTGYIYFELRDYPRSNEALGRALALAPNDKLALFTRGQSYAYQHDYAKAAADLEHVRAIDPTSRKTLFLLAGVYSRMGQPQPATDRCHMLMRLDRSDAQATEMCALVAHRSGAFDTAIALYRQALALDHSLPEIDENIARASAGELPVGSAEPASIPSSESTPSSPVA